MYTQSVKNKAIKLRKEGYSYSQISSELSIAKSTLSLWLKDIKFIPTGVTIERKEESNRKSTEVKRVDKMKSIVDALNFAKSNVGKISKRDLFILGIGIYIGEGSKIGSFIRISNSDPRIIKLSIRWFKECFGLSNLNFKIRIHLYPDSNENEAIKFWMSSLELNKDAFYSSSVDGRTNKQVKNKRVLPYGTAHLSIVSNGEKDFGVLLHRKIIASIDFVLR